MACERACCRAATMVTSAITIMTSSRVKPVCAGRRYFTCRPLAGCKLLGDAIDRRNDRYRNETHNDAHQEHENRFDQRREILCEVADLLLVRIGKIHERAREIPRLFTDLDHLGKKRWKQFRIFLKLRGAFLPFHHLFLHTRKGDPVGKVARTFCDDSECAHDPHIAFEEKPESAGAIGKIVVLRKLPEKRELQK